MITYCPTTKTKAIYQHNDDGTITCLMCGTTWNEDNH